MLTPKVSVILLTYNQEEFIGQALDSILSQQVDFAYEVIVGEDCSTDQTRAIVQDYARRYPDHLRPLYQPHNVGPGANAQACWAACTGQYVALLEGDDYWTNSLKLARQVACLDADPAASFCFHQVEIVKAAAKPALFPADTQRTTYYFTDFLFSSCASTGSLVLRRNSRTLPDWLFTTYPIDFPLMLLYAEVGTARLLPGVMSRYRVHAGGTWSGSSYKRNQDRFQAMYRLLVAHYAPTQHARLLQRTLCRLYLNAADTYLHTYNLPQEAARLLWRAARLPLAHSLPLTRSLVGVAWRWLWYQCRPGRSPLLSPPPV